MRKKYLAASLSLCMMLTSCMPLISSAESIEAAGDAGNVAYEEMMDDGSEEELMAELQDEETTIEEQDTSDEEAADEEEQLFDFYEEDREESSDLTQVYDSDNEQLVADGYTVVENSKVRYKYDETKKTLYFERISGCTDLVEIPGYAKGYQAPWFTDLINGKHCEIKKIEIGTGIVGIGKSSFRSEASAQYKYDDLEEVVLSNDVKTIGENAFADNTALKKINLNNVTEVDMQAFMDDSGLEQIEFESDSVRLQTNAFYGCKSLQSIKAKTVMFDEQEGNDVFNKCTNLTMFLCEKPLEVIPDGTFEQTAISDFDFSKVTKIGEGAFRGTHLTQICFGQKDMTIGGMAFKNCTITDICYPGTAEEWMSTVKPESTLRKLKAHCKADAAPVHATCETDGVKILTCNICGGEYTDGTVEPALGHDYSETYTTDTPATCTEAGSESKHCTRCDAIDPESVRELPALGHDWKLKVDKEATCSEVGSESNHCIRCGVVDPASVKEIPATGHQWSDWKKTSDATVFAAEQQERTCATCGKKETQTVGEKLTATASVTMSSVPLKKKQTTTALKVISLAKGDSVKSWKSTNTKVFTVKGNADGTCKLTGKKKGSAKLEITLASGLKKTVTVKVQTKTVATKKISGLSKNVTLKKGEKLSLKPVVTPATSQQKVTYKSSNKKIVTVSKSGKIKGVKKGKATITVKSGKVTKKIKITVK